MKKALQSLTTYPLTQKSTRCLTILFKTNPIMKADQKRMPKSVVWWLSSSSGSPSPLLFKGTSAQQVQSAMLCLPMLNPNPHSNESVMQKFWDRMGPEAIANFLNEQNIWWTTVLLPAPLTIALLMEIGAPWCSLFWA